VCQSGDGGLGVAILIRNGDHRAGWEIDHTLAARGCNEALKHSWAKEPAGEDEPNPGRGEILKHALFGACGAWAGEEVKEERSCRPSPYALNEIDVQRVLLRREVVGAMERVRKVGEEGVGRVEIGVVEDGVSGAEEHDGRGDG